jgi:hypothetical protein
MSYTVAILRHANTPDQDNLWKRCLASVLHFHNDIGIVIIDDNSTIPIEESSFYTIVKSEFSGAGELLPYYYYLKYKWSERMIFLHDSMLLTHPFDFDKIDKYPICYLWHFIIHNCDNRPLINRFLQILKNKDELISMFNNNKLWDGCFGVASTVRLDFLERFEEKYEFFSRLTPLVKTREDRMAMERVFSIAVFCEHPFPRNASSLCGCIHDMPFHWQEITAERIAHLTAHYPHSIIKTWCGR